MKSFDIDLLPPAPIWSTTWLLHYHLLAAAEWRHFLVVSRLCNFSITAILDWQHFYFEWLYEIDVSSRTRLTPVTVLHHSFSTQSRKHSLQVGGVGDPVNAAGRGDEEKQGGKGTGGEGR